MSEPAGISASQANTVPKKRGRPPLKGRGFKFTDKDRVARAEIVSPRKLLGGSVAKVDIYWRPGEGNRVDMGRALSEARRMAAQFAPMAMQRLIDIAEQKDDLRASLMASNSILDRAGITAPVAGTALPAPRLDLSGLNDKELDAFRKIAAKLAMARDKAQAGGGAQGSAGPVIDAQDGPPPRAGVAG